MHERVEFDRNKESRRMRTRHMPTRMELPEKGKGGYSRKDGKYVPTNEVEEYYEGNDDA